MKRVERSFDPSNRYKYDFKICTIGHGWAQLDTGQDASYFGQWINPVKHTILCYCEGDIIRTLVDTDAELRAELAEIKRWNLEQGHRFLGIDPGFNAELRMAVLSAGLAPFLHQTDVDYVPRETIGTK